mgnify:CR=1 FL=1
MEILLLRNQREAAAGGEILDLGMNSGESELRPSTGKRVQIQFQSRITVINEPKMLLNGQNQSNTVKIKHIEII